jgi:hypothetical protein
MILKYIFIIFIVENYLIYTKNPLLILNYLVTIYNISNIEPIFTDFNNFVNNYNNCIKNKLLKNILNT